MTDMPVYEQIITIAMCTLGTMATRFLPFLIFRSDKPTPKYVQYLGKMLPGAIFAMLVVYCLGSGKCCFPSPQVRWFICCWCSSCSYNRKRTAALIYLSCCGASVLSFQFIVSPTARQPSAVFTANTVLSAG